jgi:uncharacterized protein
MTALLDAAIFMYAAGAEHRLKKPCQAVLARVAAGQLDATTSAEIVQEILHRYVAIRRHEIGVGIARGALALIRPVLPLSDGAVRRALDLVEKYPQLSARDVIHVATCLDAGITTIVSPDTGFDQVSEVRRIDPIAAA